MGDLSTLFKEAVASEIEQQKSTDWKSILAQSLADTSKNYSQEFAEGQRTQGDWGSRLALSILGGAGRGFAARQSQNISEDVNNKFLSGIDQYESGKAKSLASALSGLGLESAASGVGAFDTQRRLERLQAEQDFKLKNQLELDQYNAMTPLDLERFRQKSAIEFQNQSALQAMRDSSAINIEKLKRGGNNVSMAEVAALKAKAEDPNASAFDRSIAQTQLASLMTGASGTSSLGFVGKVNSGEFKALGESIGGAQKLVDKGLELKGYAQQLKGFIGAAGDTGSILGSGIGKLGASMFAPDKFKAMENMDTMKAAQIAISDIKTAGSISDFETKMFIGAGVNAQNEPSTNKVIAERMDRLGDLAIQKGKLDDKLRQAGSLQNSATIWAKYRQENPLFKTDSTGKPIYNAKTGLFEAADKLGSIDDFLVKEEKLARLAQLEEMRSQMVGGQ